jgi:hypothetical protein
LCSFHAAKMFRTGVSGEREKAEDDDAVMLLTCS